MTEEQIDEQVRIYFQALRKKAKTDADVGKCIDKAIDRYFELKTQNEQLELDFRG